MAFKGVDVGSEAYKSLELDTSGSMRVPRALLSLSSVLERSIEKNEKLLISSTRARENEPVTIFHSTKTPNISVRHYIERIFKYSRCSPSCFVIAQIYMDRFFQHRGGYLTSLNVHRLLITSAMIAAKFSDDGRCANAYYAKIGGVSNAEMNGMELEFLFVVDFRLFVTTEEFEKYCEQLDNAIAEDYRRQNRRVLRTARGG
ncbi:hypothetical protein L6164_035044 [Bauhinia variegata]|uniref:Uncharacterized protein n=1 Tax=Bauhinia variegata TaxID=167791 RepID=A0ACB9KWY3_BAUVA|nr:hypothetical protein L6164_035044 [Bauhinia variegata]